MPCYVPHFEELCFKASPSFLGSNHPFPTPMQQNGFKLCKNVVLDWSWIYICIHLIKEGPTFKPKSSKLGTHQGQNSFTSGYHNPFKTNIFRHVWPPQISRLVPLLLAEILCFHVKATHIQKHYFEKWYGKPM